MKGIERNGRGVWRTWGGIGRKAEEGESVVNVPGGKETTERKLLCVAMFDVVGNVVESVSPRLLAHGYHHVAKCWARRGAHGRSPGLLQQGVAHHTVVEE